MATIFLSAGHGGKDPGAVNKEKGLEEADINLAILLACRDILVSKGHKVVCSRTKDEDDDKKQESNEAVNSGAEVAISIHTNSGEARGKPGDGFEVYYDSRNLYGKQLAECITKHIQATFPKLRLRHDTGILTNPGYMFLNRTKNLEAVVLVESFYINNNSECETYGTQLDKFAEAYAGAVLEYLGESFLIVPKLTTRYMVQVKSSDGELNCRQTASASAQIIKTYKNGDQLVITKESSGANSSLWGYVEVDQGWVNLKYTEKIVNRSVQIKSSTPIYGYTDYTNVDTKQEDKIYNNGDMVFINGEITTEDGQRWGYIDTDKCWINLNKTEQGQQITVQVLSDETIIGYKNYTDPNSKTSKSYTNETILVVIEKIAKDGERWGYVEEDDCWINLKHTKNITTTGALVELSLGQPIFSITETDKITSTSKTAETILAMREQENPTISNLKLVEMILSAVTTDQLEFKHRMQTVMKEEVQSQRTLANTSTSKFLVSTVSNAITDITEEDILDKLKNNKQEIVNYFKQNYNDEGWNKNINDAPETLNFWFDFMNVNNEMEKYAVSAIGDRAKAVKDDKIKAIYFENVPNTIFIGEGEEQDMSGYTYINLPQYLENYFTISAQGQSANDKLYSLLDQHTNLTENVTLTSVPIYHLQPNVRVMVKDDNTKINGEYIVSKITVPLTYNGTSSITTSKVVNKLY